MTQLTQHFSLEELLASDEAKAHGIDNTRISDEVLANLTALANGLERVRAALKVPMIVDSGYRCPALNSLVRGVANSAHLTGYAADFIAPAFGSPIEIVKALQATDIKFDQLIQEGTWVHISFAPSMRNEVLTAHFNAEHKASYTVGSP